MFLASSGDKGWFDFDTLRENINIKSISFGISEMTWLILMVEAGNKY
ncbi:hypothetical protein [Fischerella thermalis]|jgi:hypothetical protein|uniref:Uncharacterized protein n=1 Tax=Fischerella thermalis JSC-11 TaxID=741277 RepID=G6FRB2_9CYAN|nr:hypothetical protein [Fischerella thermalis]EHC15986.1 hypothetical protein FJSC11DRAFT_1409 [Fischerella thermalis JSC-11]